MSAGITAIAAALPDTRRQNDFWSQVWRDSQEERARHDLIRQLDHATDVDPEVGQHAAALRGDPFRGARERRVLDPSRVSSDLECEAARLVMDEPPDLLIVSSQLPDHPSPLNHGLVAHKLGLPPKTTAMTLDTGCASFLTGVATASRLVDSGAYRSAIVVASSVMSRITDYTTPSSPMVGDGAVAARIERCPDFGLIDDEVHTHGEWHGGVNLAPPGDDSSPWYRGDLHGKPLLAVHGDRDASHQMGAMGATRCREVCEPLLHRNGLGPDDIAFFAMAQPTAWFAPAMAQALGFPADRFVPVEEHFARFGHLMAGSVGLNLALAAQSGRIQRGDLILAYSPGAGFTQAAQLMRWAV